MADAKLTDLTETSVPALADVLYTVDVSDTTDDDAGSSRKLTFERLLGLAGLLPGGRLTTESGVDVSTSDRTSQGTVYYTPSVSDYVRLYDGTRVKEYAFTERSWAVSISSGQNKDLFLYDNAGTLTIEPSAAWTNATTRADALAWQTGLGWVKSGSPTRLWLGTVRGDGANTVADSELQPWVYNAHNRLPRVAKNVGTLSADGSTNSSTFSTLSASLDLTILLGMPQNVEVGMTGLFNAASPCDGEIGVQVDSGSDVPVCTFGADTTLLFQVAGSRDIGIGTGARVLHYRWRNFGGAALEHAGGSRGACQATTSYILSARVMR